MTQRLSQLLDEATRDIPSPDLASTAWARGRARRRRTRLATGGASALALSLIVGSAIVLSDRRGDSSTQTALPSSALPSSAVFTSAPPASASSFPAALYDGRTDAQTAPPAAEEKDLPLTPSPLPERIDLSQPSPTLIEDPLDRAVALFQSGGNLGAGIKVLGSDGRLRSLGVDLGPGGDASNKDFALSTTSLSHDGKAAAFAQDNALVVVDLTTGKSRRYDVPGVNEHLSWHPDGRTIFVAASDKAHLLDVPTGGLTPTAAGAWDSVFTDGGELVSSTMEGLARFDPTSGERLSLTPLVEGIHVSTGRPTTQGRWLAQLVFLDNSATILLVDLQTGRVERTLDVEENGGEGCCVTTGWLGTDTVVVQTGSRKEPAAQLLGWNIATGAVTRIAALPGQETVVSAPRLEPLGAVAKPPASSSPPVRSGDLKVLVAPTLAEEAGLPMLSARPLPAAISIPADPPTIAEDPMRSALALLQRPVWTGDQVTGFELFALGSDHRVRRLDVPLMETRDEGGNKALPLRDTALRADGQRAAFAQPAEVIIVDLTTGTSTRHPVPGLNEGVRWHPGGLFVVVTRTNDSVLLDTRNGAYRQYGALHAPAFTDDGQVGVELRGANFGVSENAALIEFGPDGGTVLAERELDARIGDRWGAPWVRGDFLAQDGWLRSTGIADTSVVQNPEAIVVLKQTTGQFYYALAFADMGRNKGCCNVLGWLGSDTVIFQSSQRVLGWNVRTGAVTRLTEFDQPMTLSLADLKG